MAADPKEGGPLVPSDKTADRIAGLYKAVDEAITREINAAIASGKLNRADYLRERQATIRALLRAAESQAAAATAIEIRNSYSASLALAATLLTKTGSGVIKEALDQSDVTRIEILTENATTKFSDITQFVGRRTDDIFRQVALEQLTASEGKSYKNTAEVLQRALIRAGVTQTGKGGIRYVNIGGRNLQLSKYAEMVARTTPREAASQAMVSKILRSGRDLVTVTTHNNSCPICSPYDGQTYSLTGDTAEYKVIDRLPPFHPNCRHSIGPASIFK